MDEKNDTLVLGINIDAISKEFKKLLFEEFKPEFSAYYEKIIINYSYSKDTT